MKKLLFMITAISITTITISHVFSTGTKAPVEPPSAQHKVAERHIQSVRRLELPVRTSFDKPIAAANLSTQQKGDYDLLMATLGQQRKKLLQQRKTFSAAQYAQQLTQIKALHQQQLIQLMTSKQLALYQQTREANRLARHRHQHDTTSHMHATRASVARQLTTDIHVE